MTDQRKPFRGNASSHIFHQPGCRHYKCKNCQIEFISLKEAEGAGYKPCRKCNPARKGDSLESNK